jgi:soluble lytic murein transglycosylase
MQLMPGTAKQFAKKLRLPYSERALLIPGTNIALGSRVLRDYQGYFPSNPLLAIPAYNAGPSRAKRWLEQNPNVDFDVWVELVPFRETRRYVKRVLASRGAYEMLYGSEGPAHLRLPERLHAAN